MKCPKCESPRMWIVTDTFDRAVYECADCSHREWPREPTADDIARGKNSPPWDWSGMWAGVDEAVGPDTNILSYWMRKLYDPNLFSTNDRFIGKFTPDHDAKKKKKVQKKADRDAVEAFLDSLKEGK